MKRKLIATLVGTVVALPAFGICTAFASTSTGYTSTGDTTLALNSSIVSTPTLSTGSLLFNTQEGLYQITGTNVQHDYIWVDVNGSQILALDPPKICM